MRLPPTHWLAALVVLVYVVVGVIFAVLTPAWQAPDEPAHYNTIRQVADNGCCPKIEMGDWQQTYQEQLISSRFAPELLDRLDTVQYEDHQPPLYYLLSSVVYKLFNGSLTALRIFSVLIGAGGVALMYLLAERLFADRPGVVIGSMLLFAFIPQHIAMLAALNNDGLAELLIALTLLFVVIYLTSDSRREWLLGLLVGLIFITKSTGYFLAAVVPLVIVLRWWRERGDLRTLVVRQVLFLVPALVLGSLWWLRNFGVYGFPDFLGLGAHHVVVADQLRTADFITQFGQEAYIQRALTETFRSFWAQFGWMALPLQGWMYAGFAVLLAFAGGGLLLDRAVLRSPVKRPVLWGIFALVLVFAVAAYFYYNSEFFQPQGRYLFPSLVPLCLILALGVDAWRRWLLPSAHWFAPALLALLIPFDLYVIWWVIRPLLAP